MSGLNKKSNPSIGPNSRPPLSPAARNTPSRSSSSINGVGRSPSLRGSSGISRPGRGGSHRSSPQTSFLSTNTTASDEAEEKEARAEHVSLMEELRNRVQKAETASDEYQKQLNLLQARLDQIQQEHGLLEDRLHQSNEKIEELEYDTAQAARLKRETEELFQAEHSSLLQDKKHLVAREEELLLANSRLKESLVQRERRDSEIKVNLEQSSGQFAPSSTTDRPTSNEATKAITQKEQVIKSLRLELAEAQIKIMEMDSMGGGQIHQLEKKLMEAKIANARLQEDNESFQLLLSEKTLNGDFSKTETMQQSSGLGSLAEELGSEELESAEGKTDDTRRLEAEVKSLKDQNKALALYIENIIGRLLQHKEFENILDKTPDLMSGAPRPTAADTNKDLPPPPPPKDDEQPTGFLQRARSVIAAPTKRQRPVSQLPQAPPAPSAVPNDDPVKNPSIPLSRSQSSHNNAHRRSQSEMPVVPQMQRGPPSTGSSGPLMSPGISPGVTTATRSSFFPPASAAVSPNTTPRAPSSSQFSSEAASRRSYDGNHGTDSTSISSGDRSVGFDGSPPRSTSNQGNNFTGAVMTQNRLRPLRLVQENPAREEDTAATAARKKANRQSWVPAWMGTMGMQRSTSNENQSQ